MLDQMLACPELASLPPEPRRVVRGLRLWAVMNRLRRCPLHAVAEQLGSQRAAVHLHLMVDEIRELWPEPFAVGRPCCGRLTHDEAVFAEMILLGHCKDRAGFDRLLHEMIGAEGRDRLFLSSSVLMRVQEQGGPD